MNSLNTQNIKKSLNNINTNLNYKRGLNGMSNNFKKSVLLYLISKLGERSEGRKKIMKMMFLINYFDTNKNSLIKKPLLGEEFIVYHYGVFSFDVMNNFLDLSNNGEIQGGFPIKITSKREFQLDSKLKSNVDEVIGKFGDKSGRILELETLKMLGLDLKTKKEHFGEPVTNFI